MPGTINDMTAEDVIQKLRQHASRQPGKSIDAMALRAVDLLENALKMQAELMAALSKEADRHQIDAKPKQYVWPSARY